MDEILNPREGGDVGTPAVQPRTARRTTTQRKPVKEAESSKVSTRVSRGGRGGVAEGEVEQENKDANVAAGTPAVGSRRRVPAVSTRRKKEVIVIEDDDDVDKNEVQEKAMNVAKTPAVAPSSRTRASRSVRNKTEISDETSVQKAYSTRRSVRLVGKSLSKMSLADTEDTESTKNDDVSEEMSVSQNEGGSIETENVTSSQTESNVVSQNTDEVEVSSLNKADCESQSHDSGSEVKSTDAEDVLQAEPKEEGSEVVNDVEVSHEDPSLNLQDSFETCADSNEAGSEQPEQEKTCDSAEIENKECFGAEQDQAMEIAASEEVSVEIAASEEVPVEIADQTIASLTVAEPEDAFVDVPNQDVAGLSLEASEEAYKEIADPVIAPLNVVVPDDACGDDLDQDVADMSVVLPEESSEEITQHAIAPETAVVPNGAIETSSEEHQVEEEEVFEPEPEKVECVSSAILVEKDGTSGDSGAENEVCIQSFEDKKESNGVEDVILQLSMLDVAAKKEEDQKDTSEKQEAEAQTNESEEHAVEEDTEFDEVAHINDQKTSDIESMVSEQINGEPLCPAQSEIKDIANEIQAVPSIESGTGNPNTMKENSKTIDFQKASLRVLKKLVKEKLAEKTNMIDNDDVQMQGVEKKRTALQALPQNQLAE